MKQILAMITCVCMMFALTACAREATPTQQATTTQAAPAETTVPSTTAAAEATEPISSAVYAAPLACISMPAVSEKEASGNTSLFYYSYPTVSVVLPDADVAEVVKLDLLNKIDKTAQAAQKILDTAKKEYSGQQDWYNYFMDVSYRVERLDANVLSLFGTEASFDGTPSSSTIGVSANYDLATGASLTLKSIMFPDFSADVLADLIVEGLSDYEADTFLPGYEEIIAQMFATNVPVESWYFDSNGLCFYFAPYEIAPNSMGIIYSHVPYSTLSGLMKEAYFPMEDLTYSGKPELHLLKNLSDDVLDEFDEFGELTVGEGGTKYLLRVNGSVLDLKIFEAAADGAAGKMIFAAAGIGPKSAVILDLPNETAQYLISFRSGTEIKSIPLSDLLTK